MSFLSALDFDSKKLSSLFGIDGGLKVISNERRRAFYAEKLVNGAPDLDTPFSVIHVGKNTIAENTLDVVDGEGAYYHSELEGNAITGAFMHNAESALGVDVSAVFGNAKIVVKLSGDICDFALSQEYTISTETLGPGLNISLPIYPGITKVEIFYNGFTILNPPPTDTVRLKIFLMVFEASPPV